MLITLLLTHTFVLVVLDEIVERGKFLMFLKSVFYLLLILEVVKAVYSSDDSVVNDSLVVTDTESVGVVGRSTLANQVIPINKVLLENGVYSLISDRCIAERVIVT